MKGEFFRDKLINLLVFMILSYPNFTVSVYAQSKLHVLDNLNFEILNDNNLPVGWKHFGNKNYACEVDSLITQNGMYSISIEFIGNKKDFNAWYAVIPEKIKGSQITLKGYIKTENVQNGHAGLWIRIDPNIGFDNMNKKALSGTNDWKSYEISLDLQPAKTEQIVIGGLLVGSGKAWFDNFEIFVDGNKISNLKGDVQVQAKSTNIQENPPASNLLFTQYDNPIYNKNLKDICLIWGLLKYHHPIVADGQINWDFELFNIVQKTISIENQNDRDKVISSWINSFGKFNKQKCFAFRTRKSIIKPNHSWIYNSKFSDELENLLDKITKAERINHNAFVSFHQGVGNPDFSSENEYLNANINDVGYRILSLFRYWNSINYFFPYKHLIKKDWEKVLEEYIPEFIKTNDKFLYNKLLHQLTIEIEDSHASVSSKDNLFEQSLGLYHPLINIKLIESKLYVSKIDNSELNPLMIGDEIVSINNISINELIEEMKALTSGSNQAGIMRDIEGKLLRTNDSIINLLIQREGKEQLIHLHSVKLNEYYQWKYYDSNPVVSLINDDIAYLNNGKIQRDWIDSIWNEIDNVSSLIIDLRNYPSDFPLYEISDKLFCKPKEFVRISSTSLSRPGYFDLSNALTIGQKNKNCFNGKLILLVNEQTQSSSEFHAMAYMAYPNTLVVGSTTAGTNGNVSILPLPFGYKTTFSGIGIYHPNGDETQQTGIIPNLYVERSLNGLISNEDEVLIKAIEYINK